MALFMTFISYSAEGAKGLISQPEDRGQILEKMIQKVGGRMVATYMLNGHCDCIVISEVPDGADVRVISLAAEATGAIKNVETVQAWTSADFVSICEAAAKFSPAYTPPGS